MELKIEIDGKIMEATMKVVGDTMVVSPKIEKFEPKDGDVVAYLNDGKPTIYIYKDGHQYNTSFYVAYSSIRKQCFFCIGGYLDMDRSDIRPATEEEKKKLFDKLAEEGYEFDFEKKELIKLKWKPKEGGLYYAPFLFATIFQPHSRIFTSDSGTCLELKNVGWCFKTPEECERFCEKLNKKIKEVEP